MCVIIKLKQYNVNNNKQTNLGKQRLNDLNFIVKMLQKLFLWQLLEIFV